MRACVNYDLGCVRKRECEGGEGGGVRGNREEYEGCQDGLL